MEYFIIWKGARILTRILPFLIESTDQEIKNILWKKRALDDAGQGQGQGQGQPSQASNQQHVTAEAKESGLDNTSQSAEVIKIYI